MTRNTPNKKNLVPAYIILYSRKYQAALECQNEAEDRILVSLLHTMYLLIEVHFQLGNYCLLLGFRNATGSLHFLLDAHQTLVMPLSSCRHLLCGISMLHTPQMLPAAHRSPGSKKASHLWFMKGHGLIPNSETPSLPPNVPWLHWGYIVKNWSKAWWELNGKRSLPHAFTIDGINWYILPRGLCYTCQNHLKQLILTRKSHF